MSHALEVSPSIAARPRKASGVIHPRNWYAEKRTPMLMTGRALARLNSGIFYMQGTPRMSSPLSCAQSVRAVVWPAQDTRVAQLLSLSFARSPRSTVHHLTLQGNDNTEYSFPGNSVDHPGGISALLTNSTLEYCLDTLSAM